MLLGIRFGADSCTVALASNTSIASRPDVIANEDGDRTIPCFVSFHGEDVSIGNIAKSQLVRNAKNTIPAFVELLGLPFEHETVERHRRKYAVEMEKNATTGFVQYCVMKNDQECTLSVEDVTGLFLQALVRTAEDVGGAKLEKVAITVPAHFERAQREALLRAVRASTSIPQVALVPEPSAVLAGYRDLLPAVADLNDTESVIALSSDRNILIVDIGGRSTEVTCVALRSGMVTVVAEERDAHLGGKMLDELLARHFAQEFYRKTRLDVMENKRAATKLLLACEQVKKTLSLSQSAPIHIESLYEGVDFNATINRTRFEMMCSDFAQSLRRLLEKAFTDTTWTPEQVSEVLLVGGCSRIPCLQSVIAGCIPKYSAKRHQQVDPLEVAAIGAAIEAQTRALYLGNAKGLETGDDEHVAEYEAFTVLPVSIAFVVQSADGDSSEAQASPVVVLEKYHPLPAKRVFKLEKPDVTDGQLRVLSIIECGTPSNHSVLASSPLGNGAERISISVDTAGQIVLSVE